ARTFAPALPLDHLDRRPRVVRRSGRVGRAHDPSPPGVVLGCRARRGPRRACRRRLPQRARAQPRASRPSAGGPSPL
ncbi:MAG: hypothetical protein AVDCRST_MAG47-1879, partial [uncultured Nocardioidaceae bacterium]